MKKCQIIIIALFLVLFPCSISFADDFASEANFKLRIMKTIPSLNYDQLIRLNEEVQKRLFEMSIIDGIVIPQGIYTIGSDIPSGSYRVTFDNKTGFDVCGVGVFTISGEEVFVTVLGYGGSDLIGKLVVPEEGYIRILYGDVTFYKYTGLFQ